eukprot:3895699-Amphidinium_carterae.1
MCDKSSQNHCNGHRRTLEALGAPSSSATLDLGLCSICTRLCWHGALCVMDKMDFSRMPAQEGTTL